MEQVMMQPNTSQADRIAEMVSHIFHPLLVVIPTLVIAMVAPGQHDLGGDLLDGPVDCHRKPADGLVAVLGCAFG